MLSGCSTNSVDVKGRVFIPVQYRGDLGSEFVVCDGLSMGTCIRAYSLEEWYHVVNDLNKAPKSQEKFVRAILKSAHTVTQDAQGRILIPATLREREKITDSVEFIGMGQWLELWCPEKAEEDESDVTSEDIFAFMSSMGIR